MQLSPTGLASLKQAEACENDSTQGNQLLLHGKGIPRSDPAEHVHVLDKLAVDMWDNSAELSYSHSLKVSNGASVNDVEKDFGKTQLLCEEPS